MAFWCMLFMNCLTLFFMIMRVINFMMEDSWMAPLTPTIMVMRGLTFHTFYLKFLINGRMCCAFVR